jgi:hypothetical protein
MSHLACVIAANLEGERVITQDAVHSLVAHYEGYGSEPTPAADIRAAMVERGWKADGQVWRRPEDAKAA